MYSWSENALLVKILYFHYIWILYLPFTNFYNSNYSKKKQRKKIVTCCSSSFNVRSVSFQSKICKLGNGNQLLELNERRKCIIYSYTSIWSWPSVSNRMGRLCKNAEVEGTRNQILQLFTETAYQLRLKNTDPYLSSPPYLTFSPNYRYLLHSSRGRF